MTPEEERKQKGKMRLLHEKETAIDRLTSDEYVKFVTNEVKSVNEDIIKEAIPTYCTKIKREYPLMASPNIRVKTVKAFKHLWKEDTIRKHWPKWLKNELMSDAATKREEEKRAQSEKKKLWYANTTKSEEQRQNAEREEENASKGGIPLSDYDETHPKTEKNPMDWLVETNRLIARLYEKLTDKSNMPTSTTDIKRDVIQPSRAYRIDLINGIPQQDRIFLHNWFVYLDHIIKDTIGIIEKADKTAYDTRDT